MINEFPFYDEQQGRVTSIGRTSRGHWYIEGGDGKLHESFKDVCEIWANIMKAKGIQSI